MKHEEHRHKTDFTVITGLSGAGRSTVADALEDLGYFVIDNLPPALISKMAELAGASGGLEKVGLVVDVRGGQFFPELSKALADLAGRGLEYRIVFLTASDEALIRRFEATRRRHPLADRIVDGIAKERTLLESLRDRADLVIDTSDLTVHELRRRIEAAFSHQPREASLKVNVESFGYKYGLPQDADLVLDVRFLPNPHWVDELRPLPGTDPRIRDFVMTRQATADFLERFEDLLEVLIPGYLTEGKHYLTLAVGCSGGRHRSVVISEHIAARLRDRGLSVAVVHRDIDRD
ncbi:MAG: RNase adapter RapZ [Acidobacteria bacterium]|nr:RNase adapter RapZ [Acidobacteriota bacterium]